MKNALIEAVKEWLRIVLIAVLPIIMTSINPQTGEVAINWQMVYGVALLATLKALDKWIHNNPSIKSNGLLPF